jgi:hypothetical protein
MTPSSVDCRPALGVDEVLCMSCGIMDLVSSPFTVSGRLDWNFL